MYQLTLTQDERKAINWCGNRYFHGDELHSILTSCMYFPCNENMPDNIWTDYKGDITFEILEHVAWNISARIHEEGCELACLREDFKNKLLTFCDNIV